MFHRLHALHAPADGEGDRSGAPEDSKLKPGDEGYVPPNDKEEFVPKKQFLAALASANTKYDVLLGKFEQLQAQKPPKGDDEPKVYTRAELSAAVEAKQITVEQSDEIWATQIERRVTAKVTRDVLGSVDSDARQGRVAADLFTYKELAPEILEADSEVRQKIATEYRYLTGTGLPANTTTELAAVRAVLGPIEKLKVARSARDTREFHEESGGGGEGRNRGAPKTLVETLTAREKDYYDGMIKKGMYKDWKAVEAELAFSRPEIRRKAGARV